MSKIFVSYSHKDEIWKDRVVTHLGVLAREGKLEIWDDRRISGGDDWLPEIERAMQSCDVALLLISADFLTSNFILKQEVPKLLQRRINEGIRVIPVILRPCAWTEVSWLKGIQARPKGGKPLSGMRKSKAEAALAALAKEVLRLTGGRATDSAPTLLQPTSSICIAPTRLRHGAEHLFGREKELAELDEAWNDPAKHVLTIVAWGGVGKTALVVEWMARQSAAGWPGFERVFDWPFYSQGTREQGAASADTFIAKALEFFGDEEMAKSAASPWDKGARLSQLVAQRRTLLVLDGIEPLQHPPGPLAGQLKDPALEALLRGLAQQNPGLCVVTTREHVADLAPFRDSTAPEWVLEYLSEEGGAALLHRTGATRAGAVNIKPDDQELRDASRQVQGHALTLNLLGTYLKKAHGGDIRKRDLVKFDKADAKTQGGHAFKTMAAYEKWLAKGGEEGARGLAVLRLLGLFDRPADGGCLAALRREPAIPDLAEPLVGLDEEDWNLTISFLADCGLISLAREPSAVSHQPSAIDAHPLIREYFGKQLREKNLEAWRAAHRRLYEHLKDSTEHQPDTLEGLQPLYQAVAHGCQAGLYREARREIFSQRIRRLNEKYSWRYLGAFGSDLGAIASFFDQPWCRVSPALSEGDQAWVLNEAAFCLRSLGRLTEAREPFRTSVTMAVERKEWHDAAIRANNLSELELTLGNVADALRDAEQAVTFADRCGDTFLGMACRTALADALHQAGHPADALDRFREAEVMQAKDQPEYRLLYSWFGFRYCDLLLVEPERAVWKCGPGLQPVRSHGRDARATWIALCREAEQRAEGEQRAWRELFVQEQSHLDSAHNHLILGRAALCRIVLADSRTNQAEAQRTARQQLTVAVDGLRRCGQQDKVPRGLLSRAWLHFLDGDADGARSDLDEAWQIAERGPMRLFMADIHLHRACLFHAEKAYPWKSPQDDLAAARELIEQCGYHRRDEELADAEEAAKSW